MIVICKMNKFNRECNDGYYLSGLYCLPCSSECNTCTNTATHCMTCSGSLYFYLNTC